MFELRIHRGLRRLKTRYIWSIVSQVRPLCSIFPSVQFWLFELRIRYGVMFANVMCFFVSQVLEGKLDAFVVRIML